jgi:hypothetical protein
MLHCPLWTKLLCQALQVVRSSFSDGENLKFKLWLASSTFIGQWKPFVYYVSNLTIENMQAN